MSQRTTLITDWRVHDDLPDVPPGSEYEHVTAPQKFVVLRQIIVLDLSLVSLEIGLVGVPFELQGTDGRQRFYKPKDLNDDALKKHLAAAGAAVAPYDAIAIVPGLEIRLVLRNEGDLPAKPRAALLVHEEIT